MFFFIYDFNFTATAKNTFLFHQSFPDIIA